jgi:hypothetical protein
VEGGLNFPGRPDVGKVAAWRRVTGGRQPLLAVAVGQQVLRKIEDLEEDCCRFTTGIRVCLIC